MKKREPNFENMKKVLAREVPERAVLFELFMDMPKYERLAGRKLPADADSLEKLKIAVEAFTAAGYDYATIHGSDFRFHLNPAPEHGKADTHSLNDRATITDWESFEKYDWENPSDYDDNRLDKLRAFLPDGMKLMVMGPGGVEENVINLVGYDNLCLMLYDEPELVKEIVDHVGSRILEYYLPACQSDAVGFICSNDDWGFNTQTLLAPSQLREYIFPWHKKIVELVHAHNKPCMLHSCGYFNDIIDDVIDDMKYDARHSYEDNIMPVEEAYEKYHSRIAILGGMDMGFLCRETPENIYRRSREMLERTAGRGGYALGSGNSVAGYVPFDNYMAMVRAAWEA